jgi:uncharacterized lipoprotein YddW (UPF0748 family)
MHPSLRRPLALTALLAAGVAVSGRQYEPASTVRGMWVVRTSLTSPSAVARVVQQARTYGFNALFVQVRGRGDAYYRSSLEPRAAPLADQPPGFDPLADLVDAAHRARITVHAWINVNLVASAAELPTAPDHVVNQHPEWLMVPRGLAAELSAVRPGPAHVTRLAQWSRGEANEVEGLFTSPMHPGASAHLVSVVQDIVARYPVDGVHLDYVRYPREDFDYSAGALREFRASVLPDLASSERERLDRRLGAEPFVYAETFPARWAAFRRSRLTSLVMRLRTAVKAARPEVLLTAAVVPDSNDAYARRLQDWALWTQSGLLDAVCPMAYSADPAVFTRQVVDALQSASPTPVWVGIGAYKLSPVQAAAHIQAARRAGSAGYVLFSYDSMVEAGADAYLEQVARAATDAAPAAGASGR